MRFHVVTLFPEIIERMTRYGIVGQAVKEGKIEVSTLSPRVFAPNVHQTVDDRPFGGGDGMVMMAEPLYQAIQFLQSRHETARRSPGSTPEAAPRSAIRDPIDEASIPFPGRGSAHFKGRIRVIHLSPRGRPLNDERVREFAREPDLILVASRYGGVDERFLDICVDEEVSIGDYVLSGGELPALVLIDAISRQIGGVLGNESSVNDESFARGLLEYPQFTRPRAWMKLEVPEVLLSGDHKRIRRWKIALSWIVTAQRRPDLLEAWMERHANLLAEKQEVRRLQGEIQDAVDLLEDLIRNSKDQPLNAAFHSLSDPESVLRLLRGLTVRMLHAN